MGDVPNLSRAFPFFLEALYAVEQTRDAWFNGVLLSAAEAFDRGAGVGMVLYQIQTDSVRVDAMAGANLTPGNMALGRQHHTRPDWKRSILEAHKTHVCATLNEHVRDPAQLVELLDNYAGVGIKDQIFINGLNPSGAGCVLYVFSKTEVVLSLAERALFTRIARHMATAYRLQVRLGTAPEQGRVDAVFRPNGRLDHVEPSASSAEDRALLSETVMQRERVRLHASQASSDLKQVQPMVDARWTLVDHVEPNGTRYVTARANAPSDTKTSSLSERETQVVALAALGLTNKVIAYELGLADSTVRVLIARAAAKWGLRKREHLIERFRTLSGSS